ncbi:hypothetical protein ABE545_10640 [Sphingobacterium faecium]|uniref:hypothetical protein n=1 Tax=Sphingobacterium faecium TaxID=34087 RepID=UPI00320B617B
MTTLVMVCKIIFPAMRERKEIVIHRCASIEFESTFKEMTSRGTLTLPRNIKFFDKYKIRDVLHRGDPIEISFGYNNNMTEEFKGYIATVSADIPISIEFEDEMFKVRNLPVNFSARQITLKALLEKIAPGYKVDADEIQLGSVRLSKTTVGAVIEKLQQDWNFFTYMKGKTLISGKYYSLKSDEKPFKFHLERNCVSTALNYKRKEDVLIIFRYNSTDRFGKKIEVEFGDKDYNVEVSRNYQNIKVRAELELLARSDYKKAKVDRFDGSFTAFGWPSVEHGKKVELKSGLYPDRDGVYYIEKVMKTFDVGGIRQQITLGEKTA